ncbi:flagellar motor protein MotB [Verrucomicrobia bacterium]|nr:flagellar motor protein MotB [Verrucomicrobiota bacterium]MDB4777210.1 flagellar motor protein MotB [Verrucomicrobiota bacterium]
MAAGGGGSWKVAYADFTTAMMAFFMVLWLVNQDPKIKQAVAESFKSPGYEMEKKSTGMIPNESMIEAKGTGNFSSTEAVELEMLRKMAKDLMKTLEDSPAIQADKDAFELTLTDDGVRLTVFNRPQNPIFKTKSSDYTDYGDWTVGNIAYAVDQLDDFVIEIEGHTQKTNSKSVDDDDGWKLSVDRSTVTRRKFILEGMLPDKVTKIAGFGDSKPRDGEPATSPLNDRIDIWMRVKN